MLNRFGLPVLAYFAALLRAISTGKIPLKAEEDLQTIDTRDKTPGCLFDGHTYDLEDSWHPDLGPPFGVMYCVKCECLALPRKGQITGKVRCRNFKHECPKPDCAEPVLLPNQCCKVCPHNTNVNKAWTRPDTDEKVLPDSQKVTEYLAIISSPTSRAAARGIFHFESPGLHYSLHFSPDFRPTNVVFLDESGNALFTQPIEDGRIVNQKYCGVWERIPRMFRRTLAKEALQIALTSKTDPKGSTKGVLTLKRQPQEEVYSALLLPRDARRHGVAGAASIALGADGVSLEFAIFLQGMTVVRKDVKQVATVVLERVDDRIVIRESTSAVSPKTFEVSGRMSDLNNQEIKWLARGKLMLSLRVSNSIDFDLAGIISIKPTCNNVKQVATVVLERVDDRIVIRESTSAVSPKTFEVSGRMSDLNNQEIKWLARGKLMLSLRVSNSIDFDLAGIISIKPTCNIFQAVLYDVSRTKSGPPGSGVALFDIKPDGTVDYRVNLQRFHGRPSHMTLETNPRKGRRRVIDDIASKYSSGWANGTYIKQYPKDMQNLLSDDLVISISNENSGGRMQGQIKQLLYQEVHGRTFPNIISENPSASFLRDIGGSAVAWLRLDENCVLTYDIYADGYTETYMKKLQPVLTYTYNQYGSPVRKQSQLENFKKFKSVGRVKNLKNDVLMGMPNGTIELLITAKDETVPRLQGLVTVVDDCSTRHKFNGFIMEDPTNTAMPTYTCQYKDKPYEDGSSWKSEHKPCTMCSCQRGRIICDEMMCPKVNCRNPVKVDGDCCYSCPTAFPAGRSVSMANISTSPAGCYLDKKWHKPGATWHPYIVPFGHSKCAVCTCMPGINTVNCTRISCPVLPCSESEAYRENPTDCCKKCTEPENPVTMLPANETLGDEGIITMPEDILNEGGCRFQTEIFANGAEWHPRVHPFGVMNCVLCRCKDAKSTCKRQKCPKLTCALIRKETEECCPRCTDQNDPKARPNRRLSKAGKKKQRIRKE